MCESTVMSEENVRKQFEGFENDRIIVHDEERRGMSSIQTNEIIEQVNRKLRYDRRLTFSLRLMDFDMAAARPSTCLNMQWITVFGPISTRWMFVTSYAILVNFMECLVNFMECLSTVTADVYSLMLTKLRCTILKEQRSKMSSGVMLFHDNALPHSVAITEKKIQDFRWRLVDHLPCSPDLALSSYLLLTHLKQWLSGLKTTSSSRLALLVNEFPGGCFFLQMV